MVTSPVGEWGRQTSRDPCYIGVLHYIANLNHYHGKTRIVLLGAMYIFYSNTLAKDHKTVSKLHIYVNLC